MTEIITFRLWIMFIYDCVKFNIVRRIVSQTPPNIKLQCSVCTYINEWMEKSTFIFAGICYLHYIYFYICGLTTCIGFCKMSLYNITFWINVNMKFELSPMFIHPVNIEKSFINLLFIIQQSNRIPNHLQKIV